MTTVNGFPIIGGAISMPRRGAWVAHLHVDTTTELVGPIVIATDGFTLRGTAVRSSVFAGDVHVFAVAGGGGLQSNVDRRGYTLMPGRTIATEALAEVGEALDPSSDAALDAPLKWARHEGTADTAVTALAEHLDLSWRVEPSGLVWLGVDAYPNAPTTFESSILDRNDATGRIVLGCAFPWLLPGTTFEGLRVEHVVHEIGDSRVRSFVSTAGSDRFRGALERIVRKSLPELAYLRGFAARVVGQNPDGSLEVVPDELAPPLSRVPIRYGLPGISAKIAPGARCRVTFDDGDPSKPKAELFDAGSLLEVKITCPQVVIGSDLATPVAHAIPAAAAFAEIAAMMQAAASAAAAKASASPGNATRDDVASYLAGMNSAIALIASKLVDLPTLTTRIA